jgi:hypothetical protein
MSQPHNDTTGSAIGQMFPDGPYRSDHCWSRNEAKSCTHQSSAGGHRTRRRLSEAQKECPGLDARAFQSYNTGLLACHSVQSSLTFIMLGEDNVDLRIGRDRDYDTAGEI